ncbi:hypothetical protein B0A49_14037 [Cryomyces minteri]|uniref:SnoaL-like domain-containing protein n=1 Tax=Cryomyces minteri TaxID=331657 RepID=A0A4U0VFB8_9PEZI|nr:hypothetical protein B0A49_14037 [Cryomyces minteri]
MASVQRSTALAFLQSFQELDVNSHLALRTPGCRHTMAPASLNYPPSMTNEQFAAHLSSLRTIIASFPVTAKEIFEHEGGNQVTIWATSSATFREEAKDEDSGLDWSYYGEYIFILSFNQAGDKIERIVEFVDSKRAVEVGVLVERARRNVAARKENPYGDNKLAH